MYNSGAVASYPTPLKVSHAAACNAAPTLAVQLPTTFEAPVTAPGLDVTGALTANGVNVGTKLSTITGTDTWTTLTPSSNYEHRSETLGYLVKNGVVYLRGAAGRTSGDVSQGDQIVELPTGVRPAQMGTWTVGNFDGGDHAVAIYTNGTVVVRTANGGNHVHLDNVAFPLAS